MKRYLSPLNLLLLLGLSGYLLLLAVTISHTQPPLHDEPYFLANMDLYREFGFSRDFLLQMEDQAPGPLYQFVHAALQPLTHLDVPGVRLVNVFMLGLAICLLALLMRRMSGLTWKVAFVCALNMMAAPMIWQISGMALTEIPAMLFSFLSVLLLWFALRVPGYPAVVTIIAAGLLAGLGILGRTPFLALVLAALVMIAWYIRAKRYRQVGLLSLYIVISLAVCLPVFNIWGGLTPPKQAYISNGLSLWHGILGFSYAAMVTLIIAPRWFIFSKRIAVGLGITYLVCLTLNLGVFSFTYTPLNKALARVMPPYFMEVYPYLISPFLATLAIYFAICLLIWYRRNEAQPFNIYLLTVVTLLLCSNLAVTHLFSSRYVAQLVPFFLPVLWQAERINGWKTWRYVLGMLLGFLSLETYFNFS